MAWLSEHRYISDNTNWKSIRDVVRAYTHKTLQQDIFASEHRGAVRVFHF